MVMRICLTDVCYTGSNPVRGNKNRFMRTVQVRKVGSDQADIDGLKRIVSLLEGKGFACSVETACDIWSAATDFNALGWISPYRIATEFQDDEKLWKYISPVIEEI